MNVTLLDLRHTIRDLENIVEAGKKNRDLVDKAIEVKKTLSKMECHIASEHDIQQKLWAIAKAGNFIEGCDGPKS